MALYACEGVGAAAEVLEGLEDRRFAAILHHYELSNWVLYCRAHASGQTQVPVVRAVDTALKAAPVALEWLEEHWVRPAVLSDPSARPHRRGSPR